MAVEQNVRLESRLCSLVSRANKEDPGGSAPTWDHCLIVELPKPWHRAVVETRHFPGEVSAALARADKRGMDVRLQCVAPDDEYSAKGHTRIIMFSRPTGPFAVLDRQEFLVPDEETGAVADALLSGAGALDRFAAYVQDTSSVRDLLVCTHGTRDVCCGSYGYPIYHGLRHTYAPQSGGRLRVWRVSHIGGHRLSPNVVDMPEGRYWCRVQADELSLLVNRDRPIADMSGRHRGWVGMDSPFEQVAEQEALMAEGWGWTGMQKSGRVTDGDGVQAAVRIEFEDPESGVSGAYEAEVERSESVPSATCLDTATPGEEIDQYKVRRLARVS